MSPNVAPVLNGGVGDLKSDRQRFKTGGARLFTQVDHLCFHVQEVLLTLESGLEIPANLSVVGVLVLTFLAGVPYVMDARIKKAAVPTVHIDNLDSVVREIQNGRPEAAEPAPAAAPAGRAGEQNNQRRDAAEQLGANPD